MDDDQLVIRRTIHQLEAAYYSAMRSLDSAYSNLDKAHNTLAQFFPSKFGMTFDVLPRHFHGEPSYYLTEIKTKIKAEAWKYAVELLDLRRVMSDRDYSELMKRFEITDEDKIPPFTSGNVLDILVTLVQSSGHFQERIYQEAYKVLMVGLEDRSYQDTMLKTNQKNARNYLGKKVILSNMIFVGYHERYFEVRGDYAQGSLSSVDKAFHLLDGRGTPEGYNTPLIDAINTTLLRNPTGITEYFVFRCCKNGNLHLEFRRTDLVSLLNQRCAEKVLPEGAVG